MYLALFERLYIYSKKIESKLFLMTGISDLVYLGSFYPPNAVMLVNKS